jgi:predicted helicase
LVYFDPILDHRIGIFAESFPDADAEAENRIIGVTSPGSEKPFMALAAASITDLHLVGPGASAQCFPFYLYDEAGTNHRENVTDWALEQFRKHYEDETIAKWDIFYYVYGFLHHPEYRAKYAENLKRELPRIPLAKDFRAFADAGKELAQLHIDYEKLEPYPLKFLENKDLPLSYRVEDKMRLSKDRKSLKVNDSLTLAGIPPEAFEYRLGNRSALEWVIDQYQVTEDKHSGIRSDPNRPDDPEYIVRLVGQVVRVSLGTVRIVGAINALPLA